ncbi:Ig-like domain-containing protein [Sphingobacterium sp. lm-10]|uniref:Ig-like domain-containing protein n=1 Tax=Sphingobacterium sp. lm-10 TaxID=2944904 RepID=UPI0020213733|nr:Ig-like domain-containing protein [Sphingobacterium sp. lm-10]MCL7988431.1 Ig-like domain-containing protein [Sphingobacterium sp. lm-10]
MSRPTGGPKDSIPPSVVAELPANFSTNFTERKIIISFDEYVKTTNQQKEFSASPDMDIPPIYKIRKRDLHIQLPDSLEENTTYTINLGKGLVDFNEGNPILNYTYVFSTGPELDSLSISGRVSNGYTQSFDPEKDKDINVILIPTSRDSIFGRKKASIFTTVDTSGTFRLQNLKEDTYRIYAIKEQNNDRTYNAPDEWIGFLKDSIVLKRDTAGIHLELSQGTPRAFKTLERKLESSGMALLVFNKALEDPSVRIIDPVVLNDQAIPRFAPTMDSVRIYLPNLEFDSIKFQMSDNSGILDTSLIRRPRNLKLERTVTPKFSITNKVDRVKHIQLSATTPIKQVDKNKIILLEDSIPRRNFQLQADSVNKELYHIRYNWRPKRNYELTLEEGAIHGFFDEENKEEKLQFTMNEAESYGDIALTFNGLDTTQQYVIELISENKEKIFESHVLPTNHQLAYRKYPTGKYSIRVIWDKNRNAKWDPADVWTLTKQEPIWYLDRTFTIRANWEQNETIDVRFAPN